MNTYGTNRENLATTMSPLALLIVAGVLLLLGFIIGWIVRDHELLP